MSISHLLRGTRVRLTALTPDDLSTMARWHEDVEFLRLYDARPAHPKSEAELSRWLEETQKDERTRAFAIRPLDGEELIGTLELDGTSTAGCGTSRGVVADGSTGETGASTLINTRTLSPAPFSSKTR